MGTPRSIAAVVVTYNRADVLPRCLDAILAQEGASADCVLVLDNGSTDNTPEVLAGYSDRGVVRLDAGANTGSAGGFHLGVYEAVMRGYDLVWIMDDDVVPDPGALAALLDADRELGGDWGFLSSVAYWKDGTPCRPNIQKKGLFTFVGQDDYAKPLVRVRIAAMASLMLRAEVVREVGLPMAEYFFYTDDYEYTWRVSEVRPCYMVTASTVLHAMAGNQKPNLATDSADRLWRYRYLYRNDASFYRKLGPKGWAYLVLKVGYTVFRVLAKRQRGKRERASILYNGLMEGVRFNPSAVYFGETERMPNIAEAGNRIPVIIYTEAWLFGGIESFVMSILRLLPKEDFDVTIISTWGDTSVYEEELAKLGVSRAVLYDGCKPGLLSRTLGGIKQFRNVVKNRRFDVAHVNTMNGMGFAYTWVAQKANIPIRIAHSHNSWFGEGSELPKRFFHFVGRHIFGRSANVRLACSPEAGRHLFKNEKFEVINNGVDTKRFAFDSSVREAVRAELGICNGDYLVGSVGRISAQKDPLFQVDVFAALAERLREAKCLLVGSGEMEEEVLERIVEYGLEDRFIHVPATSNPERYLCALDAFLFPSVYEGLGIAAVEAQCCGLPVLASNHLPRSMSITDLVRWEDKELSCEKWADDLIQMRAMTLSRGEYASVVAESGYSSTLLAKRVAAFYRGESIC